MFRTNSSTGGRVWNSVAPEKGMNVKTRITHPHERMRARMHACMLTRAHSLQSSSARASPFCPHWLTWSCSAAWTQHVSWKDRRSQLSHCGPLLTNHLYHTALQGYQRENSGQPFAQTRGLTNNVLTCWEIFKTYSWLPSWFFFLTYNLFVEKLLLFCVTPIKHLYRKWTPPAQITPYSILGHLNKTGSKWHCTYIKCYYALNSSVKTIHSLVCVERGKGTDTRVHNKAEHGELPSMHTWYLCQRLQTWTMIFR